MNKEFLKLFLEKTVFPAEAAAFLLESADRLTASGGEQALEDARKFYFEHGFDSKATDPLVAALAEKAGFSPYTGWLLLLIEAALAVRDSYRTDEVFWDTFCDLRYKALECREIHDTWGNFVSFWYPIFYNGSIVKLGRLEYESTAYHWDIPYEKGGITVRPGDPVKSIHIPSSGEPFDEAARMASYRKAYEYFKPELNGGPLVCVCHSWLLYPPYADLLSPTSNIRAFQGDFDIIGKDDSEKFGDAWRLFGRDYQKPTAELPERTSMQKAFKEYLLRGGVSGEGRGVLIFDGEKIVNR